MADSGLSRTVEEMILEVWRESRTASVRLGEVGVELRTMSQQIAEMRAGLTGRVESLEARLNKVEDPVEELAQRKIRREGHRTILEEKTLAAAAGGIAGFLATYGISLFHRMGW